MPETFPDISPDRNSKKTVANKINRADFGDGYSQTAPDGINNRVVKWSLSFANYPGDLIDNITLFLDSRAENESFYWTPPFEDTPTLWKQVGGYDLGFPGGSAKTLTVTFQQVPL